MLKIHFVVIILIISQTVFCQLNNYNEKGKKLPLVSEKDSIVVNTKTAKTESITKLLLSAISPAIGVGIDVAKTILEKRAASFTAIYSASYTGSGFYINDAFSLDRIKLYRLTKSDVNAKQEIASLIDLSFDEETDNSGMFRLKIDNIILNYSKAKIKKCGRNGKTIDLSINVKIDASWRDYSVDKDNKKNISYSIKSSTLGESSIIVTGLKPGKQKICGDDNSFYSNWFQSIPNQLPEALESTPYKLAEKRNRGWYTIIITVKEANPYGVSSNTLNSFLKNYGSDVSSFLKAFAPKSSSDSDQK